MVTASRTPLLTDNDRPSITLSNGRTILLGQYDYDQPGFAELNARIQKDFKITDRYHVLLSGDFFNLTNRGNVYSNPDTNGTLDYSANCVSRAPEALGFDCSPLTSLPRLTRHGSPGALGAINQIAPGSTPFAFQAGAKFVF